MTYIYCWWVRLATPLMRQTRDPEKLTASGTILSLQESAFLVMLNLDMHYHNWLQQDKTLHTPFHHKGESNLQLSVLQISPYTEGYHQSLEKAGVPRSEAEGDGTPEEEVVQAQNTWPMYNESSETRQGKLGEWRWVDRIGRGGIGSYKGGGLLIWAPVEVSEWYGGKTKWVHESTGNAHWNAQRVISLGWVDNNEESTHLIVDSPGYAGHCRTQHWSQVWWGRWQRKGKMRLGPRFKLGLGLAPSKKV